MPAIQVEETTEISAEYEVVLSMGDNSYTVTVTVDSGDFTDADAEVTDFETASGNEPGESTADRLCAKAIAEVTASYYKS
jgi:hypothetical protein